jgi:hypothetical protein
MVNNDYAQYFPSDINFIYYLQVYYKNCDVKKHRLLS